jgi:hypothetical protein
MFNPNRVVPKYNSIRTITNFNRNKKLYQQIVNKNKKRSYNEILKRTFTSSASYDKGESTSEGGGGGDGNDYWKLIAMAVSVYFVTNIGKPPPPPPNPFKDVQWNLLTKKYI